MRRQGAKNDEGLKELQEDIQFLLSNIRARENGLIFFLQRFTNQCRYAEQFTVFKEEFMQKEKIYASQVSRIVGKYTCDKPLQIEQQIRTFWIKVKSIVKVSLERLRILNLLNERIFTRYEEIISLINYNYDNQKGLEEFSSVENLLKKRNVDALIFGKGHFSSHNSESKMSKNRSQSAFKQQKFSPKPKIGLEPAARLDFELSSKEDNDHRLKSLNRYGKKKALLESKGGKSCDKSYKKMLKNLDRYCKCWEGVMDGTIDYNFDKKKTGKENEEVLYDDLFKRNIPNHKSISKFLFGTCGITHLLSKKARVKGKKILVRENKEKDFKEPLKLNKSKQPKQKQRPQSSQIVHLRMSEDEKKRAIQALLTDKKGKYRKKIGGRPEKYSKLLKLIS